MKTITINLDLYNTLIQKLNTYQNVYGNVLKCRKCVGYYVSGFVCCCGEDNSVKNNTN